MRAFVFPGQGAQFSGMGKNLYDDHSLARVLFNMANKTLGFDITQIMFNGSEEDLRQTKVTQPAIFLHSVILAATLDSSLEPEMVAGHSLGEFSALVVNKTLSFVDGLILVSRRASAMQKACEAESSTMAAIIGLEDTVVEEVCDGIQEIVVPANYNSPGQIVISGSIKGIDIAVNILNQKGAKHALKLSVGGAFHSPLMEPARKELAEAIMGTHFSKPVCPVYQNVDAKPYTDPEMIRNNLIKQLTSPVRWAQTIINMIADKADSFIEVGPGKVLQGLIKKINKDVITHSI